MVDLEVVIEYGLGQECAVHASAEVDEASISGAYVRVFFAEDMDRSSDAVIVTPFVAEVRVERRWNLAAGSPLRIELQLTAGQSEYPVTVTLEASDGVQSQVLGVTGQTILVGG